MQLSNYGWAVLAQLCCGSVWDGDLVSKSGRNELISRGLATRHRKDRRGLSINELTSDGLKLAARYQAVGGRA